MSNTGQTQRISLILKSNGNVKGLEKLPDGKKVSVIVHDEMANTDTPFRAFVHNGKVSWYIKGNKGDILCPGLTSLTGREYVKKLPSRAQKTFDEATVEFLKSICLDFKDLQTMIDRDMEMKPTKVRSLYKTRKGDGKISKSKMIDMWCPNVEAENRYRIIKGFMQSRKTWAIISSCLYYLLKYRMSTFIVVQNSLDACEQLLSRIRGVFSEYVGYMEKEDLKGQFEELFKVLDCDRGKTVSSRDLEKAMNGHTPRVFIIIRNIKDINAVNNTIEKLQTRRYVVMIDESDFNDSGSQAGVNDELSLLKENAGLIYDVTATPMTSIMKEDIDAGNVIVLSKPDGYKGILSVQCYNLPKKAEYCTSVDDDPFVKDKNLRKYINDFAKTKPHNCRSYWGRQKHPRYSLVRFGKVINPQLRVASWVYKHHGDKIVTITYNGSSCGVSVRSKLLPTSSIILDDGTKSKYEQGVHNFPNGLHVGKVIAYLQNNGGVEKYHRIMVLAGSLADRGISFGTCDWGSCIRKRVYPWHLTEMYFIAAKGMNQANLLQASGRLCGVYPDNTPLSLYTNAGDDIYKAFGLQEELIARARQARITSTFKRLAKELIPDLAISKEKCSKRKITAPSVSCRLRKVEDDFLHGGMNWDIEGFSYDGEDVQFGEGFREQKPKTFISEEEKERMREDIEIRREEMKEKFDDEVVKNGLDRVRRAYKTKTSFVYKIIKLFIDNDFESLSVSDMREVTSEKFNVTNYDRWGQHNKYKIIEPTKSGHYNLCSDIVELLHLV